mmetsp:Transcript_84223/g.234956  ORF Transcript_84223/g.234956 Transcript_84223/m.234956 type:complete len:217 (+) Transcript_84223:1014-1664(+)
MKRMPWAAQSQGDRKYQGRFCDFTMSESAVVEWDRGPPQLIQRCAHLRTSLEHPRDGIREQALVPRVKGLQSPVHNAHRRQLGHTVAARWRVDLGAARARGARGRAIFRSARPIMAHVKRRNATVVGANFILRTVAAINAIPRRAPHQVGHQLWALVIVRQSAVQPDVVGVHVQGRDRPLKLLGYRIILQASLRERHYHQSLNELVLRVGELELQQ